MEIQIISRHTKLNIFNSNVKSVLAYCMDRKLGEPYEQLQRKIQVFINKEEFSTST